MPRTITLVASRPHYLEHMLPTWEALPSDVRGDNLYRTGRRPKRNETLLLASYNDVLDYTQNRYIWHDHGWGQSYETNTGGYSGNRGHERALGFLAPTQEAADRWKASYPNKPVYLIGCPKINPVDPPTNPRSIAITFHWPGGQVSNFASWAFPHYRNSLQDIIWKWKKQGYEVYGHGHPKAWTTLRNFWKSIQVPAIQNFQEVVQHCQILVCDNSSVMPEWQQLGRPMIALNCPAYDKHKSVGGRFWEWPLPNSVNNARELDQMKLENLSIPEWIPFPFVGQKAAQLGAQAIVEILTGIPNITIH